MLSRPINRSILPRCCWLAAAALGLEGSQLKVSQMVRCEILRRDAEYFFELAAKMSVGCKIQFRSRGFAGITLGDQFLGEAAL